MKRPAGIKTKAKTQAKTKSAAKTKAAPVKSRAVKPATKPASKSAKPKNAAAKAAATPTAAAPDALDVLVTTGAATLKLPLDPAWHGGVKFNLGLIMRMGALVDEFPLPDDAEPGPVFNA